MHFSIKAAIFAAVSMTSSAAMAGPISQACLTSDRLAANRSVCSCIQHVADQTLSASDQRLAAKFFKEPQMAQDVRMSKTNSDDRFWDRYERFGNVAVATCS